jgi:hypothetical protein
MIEENPFEISLIFTCSKKTIPPTMLISGESDSSNGKMLSIVISDITTTEEIDLALVLETFDFCEITDAENKAFEIFRNSTNLQKVAFTFDILTPSYDPVI